MVRNAQERISLLKTYHKNSFINIHLSTYIHRRYGPEYLDKKIGTNF